ncbi:MAG: hypothetical protein ACYDCL_06450 [Myxococcales bacterium]
MSERFLLLSLLLCAACSGGAAGLGSGGAAGGAGCQQAGSQAQSALQGTTSCQADSDCVLVPLPTCAGVPGASPGLASVSGFVAVSNGHEASVEHAFSVIQAETCPTCSSSSGGAAAGGLGGLGGLSSPAAFCSAGACAVESAPSGGTTGGGGFAGSDAGQGVFEWSCGYGCDSDQYCAVESAESACAGFPGYFRIGYGGSCAPAAGSVPLGGPCQVDADCGLGNHCNGSGLCDTGCTQPQPLSCDGGCQLSSDDQGCVICDCPSACPAAPDGGLDADAGADAGR